MREVLNALLYMVVAGGAWRMMPHDFPKWQTVYDYFRNWKKDGTFESMNTQLSKYVRVMEGRRESPSASMIVNQCKLLPWQMMRLAMMQTRKRKGESVIFW
jgi:putative transposase